jgi:hypothetical protein
MPLSEDGDLLAEQGFWATLWWSDLRQFFRHFITDIVYTMCILILLEIFWEGIQWFKFRGYPADRLDKLDGVHFVFVYLALLAVGIAFIVKLIVLLCKNH